MLQLGRDFQFKFRYPEPKQFNFLSPWTRNINYTFFSCSIFERLLPEAKEKKPENAATENKLHANTYRGRFGLNVTYEKLPGFSRKLREECKRRSR